MTTTADIREALNTILQPQLADAVKKNMVLLHLLPIIKNGRNSSCTWTVKFGARNAARTDDGSDVAPSDFSTELRRNAYLEWARYTDFASVDGLAESLAAANAVGMQGMAVNPDLLLEEVMDATHNLAKRIASDLYVGTGINEQIAGAVSVVTGNAYAGIDATTGGSGGGAIPEWVAIDNTIAEADLDIATLRSSLHRPFKDASGYYPEFVTVGGALFDKIGALFDTDIRHVTAIRTEGSSQPLDLELSGGFRAIYVDGVPYVEDPYCPDNTLHAWHTKSTQIVQVPKMASDVVASGVRDAIANLTGVDLHVAEVERQLRTAGAGTLAPRMITLAKNGDSTRAQLVIYLQMRNKLRNHHARLTVTPTP